MIIDDGIWSQKMIVMWLTSTMGFTENASPIDQLGWKKCNSFKRRKKKEQSMRGLPHWFMENMKILVEHGPW